MRRRPPAARLTRALLASPLLASLALTAGLLLAAPAQAGIDDYQLGQGLELGPINLAGYSSVTAALPDQGHKSLAIDDLSLFISGHVTSLVNPFVEAELTGLDLTRWGGDGDRHRDGYVVLERVYNDIYLPDGFTLRAGKMLAPVGEWNQIHAAPLVLSTVRPAVTYRNFSEYATGLSVLYADPAAALPDIQVYWQPAEELSARPDSIVDNRYRLVQGAHVSVPLALLDKVGLSFQRSVDDQGTEQHLYGLDGHYTVDRLTLQGEWTYSTLSGPGTRTRSREWGGFLSPSYALDDQWSVYGWYEIYSGRLQDAAAQDLLGGVAYRPHPAMVFKLEYVQNVGGRPVNPTGLFASWSVLF
ncbi:hypothetical protein [Nitrospirillum iridis]|uniref:Porin n=1 Tax=Nitrospirillum iridis TaxID=765888 RepID=A0A7X0AW38_9PROT|nr:hypothetical protein [Nitrospirillum iridis]MBB6251209.1 hypothetical protein [Nitrospirillum iridis]